MTQLHRYLSQINFGSFREAAIEKVTTGVTTLTEVLRVLPHSALSRKSWVELIPSCSHRRGQGEESRLTPDDIFLLVEVADTTLYTDRNQKAPACAKAGIADYWVLNVNKRYVVKNRR